VVPTQQKGVSTLVSSPEPSSIPLIPLGERKINNQMKLSLLTLVAFAALQVAIGTAGN
jgi:hypothetical protein